jgi:hypothetical protein
VRELRRFEATWSVQASATEPEADADTATWRVATSGPNWHVDTLYRFVRWDDVMESLHAQPMWRRILLGLLSFVDFVGAGALWGYFRFNWRYAVFFLYPFVLLAALAGLAVLVGTLVARLGDSGLLGAVAGLAALVLLLRWPGRRFYLSHLLDDWNFSRAYLSHGDPTLDARFERLAQEIVRAAREGEASEILVIGHSLGAVLAADLVDRALRLDPALGRDGSRVAFVSVGSSILKIGLHRGARRLHAALERIASAPGIFWAEYQARADIMNFFDTDPIAAMHLNAAGRPLVRKVQINRMLDRAAYRRMRSNFFRVHCQFVSGNTRRTAYDYFMLLCGPLPVERQVRAPDGAEAAIRPDGALVDLPSVDPAPRRSAGAA